jgi:hypothetical protein
MKNQGNHQSDEDRLSKNYESEEQKLEEQEIEIAKLLTELEAEGKIDSRINVYSDNQVESFSDSPDQNSTPAENPSKFFSSSSFLHYNKLSGNDFGQQSRAGYDPNIQGSSSQVIGRREDFNLSDFNLTRFKVESKLDLHEIASLGNSKASLGNSDQQLSFNQEKYQFTSEELEFISNGILNAEEIYQQRAELSRYQDLERGSSFKSQNFPFHGADLSRGDDGLQHEQMAKSGPAKGIDHKFIERMNPDLKPSIDQDFPLQNYEKKMDEMDAEILGIVDKLKSRHGIGQGVFGNQNDDEEMLSLVGSPREQFGNFQEYPDNFTTHLDLDFNQTEIELMEAGITIEEIMEQRQFATEQFATEQFISQSGSQNQGEMQPLNAENLGSNSRERSPSRE